MIDVQCDYCGLSSENCVTEQTDTFNALPGGFSQVIVDIDGKNVITWACKPCYRSCSSVYTKYHMLANDVVTNKLSTVFYSKLKNIRK